MLPRINYYKPFLALCFLTMILLACRSSEDPIEMGQIVFDEHCAECHTIEPVATAPEVTSLANLFAVSELRNFLSNGKELTIPNVKVLISTGYEEMPGTALEPEQMDALVEYMLNASREDSP